jgi:isoleucyl-tRNA synthetase
MDVVEQIKWIPEFGFSREMDWLRNMHDWLISKKRYWGLALPIWECSECGNFEVIGSDDELQQRATSGLDVLGQHTPHRPYIDAVKITCSSCGAEMSRVRDVGNPWLDAGIVPFSTMRYATDRTYWEKWFPADLVLEEEEEGNKPPRPGEYCGKNAPHGQHGEAAGISEPAVRIVIGSRPGGGALHSFRRR